MFNRWNRLWIRNNLEFEFCVKLLKWVASKYIYMDLRKNGRRKKVMKENIIEEKYVGGISLKKKPMVILPIAKKTKENRYEKVVTE